MIDKNGKYISDAAVEKLPFRDRVRKSIQDVDANFQHYALTGKIKGDKTYKIVKIWYYDAQSEKEALKGIKGTKPDFTSISDKFEVDTREVIKDERYM